MTYNQKDIGAVVQYDNHLDNGMVFRTIKFIILQKP